MLSSLTLSLLPGVPGLSMSSWPTAPVTASFGVTF